MNTLLINELKNKINTEGIQNCQNYFQNKTALLLCCGPSIESYKHFIMPKYINDTLLVTIKTATNYSQGKEDFFFYDKRIYRGHRTNFKYKLNTNSIKVFLLDHFKNIQGNLSLKNSTRYNHLC